jgi:hypothetical protein
VKAKAETPGTATIQHTSPRMRAAALNTEQIEINRLRAIFPFTNEMSLD